MAASPYDVMTQRSHPSALEYGASIIAHHSKLIFTVTYDNDQL